MKTIASLITFAKNACGCLNNPYVTIRTLSIKRQDFSSAIVMMVLTIAYFSFASLIRTGLQNPFLLTVRFNSLLIGALVGFLGMVALLSIGGKVLKGYINVASLIVLWSYTLLPTLLWFLVTSLLFIFIPPPRTMSFPGKVFSSLYLVFSMAVLLWKMILYYLTLRFGLRFDLSKIVVFSLIMVPFIGVYSWSMYRLGIFRIPFL